MKPTPILLAAALLCTGLVQTADAHDDKDRRKSTGRQAVPRDARDRDVRYEYDVRYERDVRYFEPRDVYVIRDYYRPHHRPLPRGHRVVYAKRGHLPPGWAKRMRPLPVYVERRLPVLPRGYRRGIIDGHAIVYNPGGLILDIAVLF